ncbi:hypothetical protein J4422_03240 [Candidatus Pacearchaeota archaeon]|nr:hypothetical protein [Candidatus Pacearchaeota archaeon]
MSFVNITNYDGDKGYLEGDRESLKILDYKGVKYALRVSAVPDSPSNRAFRIIRESEETAQAVETKDQGLIKILGRKYWREAEKAFSIQKFTEKELKTLGN